MSKPWHGSKWIRKERRRAIYERDDWCCLYCERDLRDAYEDDPHAVTLDHLVPRDEDGSNRNDNLVTACLSCNSARQSRDWRIFAPGATTRITWAIAQPVDVARAKAKLAGLVPA